MSTDDYAPYMKKYIDVIKDYKCNRIQMKKHKVFEYLVAIELKMIMFKDAKDVLDKYVYLQKKADYGTDLIDLKCTRTAQVTLCKKVTHGKTAKYVAHSVWKLGIPDMTLVVNTDCELSHVVKDFIPNIITYDFDTLLEKVVSNLPNIIILPKKTSLSILEKITEMITFFDAHGKPPIRHKFSDNHDMHVFWNNIIYNRKLNSPAYNLLMCHDDLRRIMFKNGVTQEDEKRQVRELIKFANHNDIEACNQLVIWNECKLYKKFNNPIWLELATVDILRDDYEQYVKIHFPDDYVLLKKINNIIMYADEYDISSYDFWLNCKQDLLCDKWPYIKLLCIPKLEAEYIACKKL